MNSDSLLSLLNDAQAFVGKSRCSLGHSVSEVMDRAKANSCIYCKQQFELYERLGKAFQQLPASLTREQAEQLVIDVIEQATNAPSDGARERLIALLSRASETKGSTP